MRTLATICLLLITFLSASASLAAQESRADESAVASQFTEYHLPPALLKKSEALYRTRISIFAVSTLYGIALLFLVLNFRIGARYRDLAERVSSRRFVQAIVFAPLLLITMDVLGLPLSIYRHALSVSYGLSVQGWESWSSDWIKSEVINTAVATLLIWGLYAILRRSPRHWWLYGWLATIPVVLLMVFVQPILIDPLFDKFDPLEQKQPQLLVELEKVMHRGGLSIDRSRMFEMRASDKVTTYNAYVTGIGSSKRVVVWDNTAKELTIPQTMFVFGHEQGHYVLNHIWKGLALSIAGMLAMFYLAWRLLGSLILRWGDRWNVRDPTDWASFPVLLLMLTVGTFLAQPLVSGVSRYMEHEADIYGLEVIHGLVPDSSSVGAQAFQRLGEKGLAWPSPNPLFVLWTYDHPTIADRVAFAAAYQPWNAGVAPQFVR